MADHQTPPKASELLTTYHQALKAGGLGEELADAIVCDAAEKLHRGELAVSHDQKWPAIA